MNSRKSFKYFAICVVGLLSAVGTSFADDIYKWTDETGKVHFSTTPQHSGQKPAALPEVQRENLEQKTERVRAGTPTNCLAHGGNDCAQGPDEDGSVICLDGFKDSATPFRQFCSEARVKPTELHLIDADGTEFKLDESTKPSELPKNAQQIRLTVRNNSGVDATQMDIKIYVASKQSVVPQGPETIKAYGIADYTLSLFELSRKYTAEELKKTTFSVNCLNCAQAVGTRPRS